MKTNTRIEVETDLELIKRHALLPILLDMLIRDEEKLKSLSASTIFGHISYDLKLVEQLIHDETRRIRIQLKDRGIQILSTETSKLGIDISYKLNEYTHQYVLLRSLVKAEVFVLFGDFWTQIGIERLGGNRLAQKA
jgi:hypothetical protein